MSITITLPTDIAISTYEGLTDFLTDHLQLSATTVAQLPTLVRLAETRLDRIITDDAKETSTFLSTVSGQQYVTLPSDLEALQQVRLTGSSGYPLAQVPIDQLEEYDVSGMPIMYAMHGGALQLAPIPDGVYTLALRYSSRLTPLTESASSNWLLTQNPDAYVYMAAAVICQHIGDKEGSKLYLAMADGVAGEINMRSVRHKFGGNLSPRMVATP